MTTWHQNQARLRDNKDDMVTVTTTDEMIQLRSDLERWRDQLNEAA